MTRHGLGAIALAAALAVSACSSAVTTTPAPTPQAASASAAVTPRVEASSTPIPSPISATASATQGLSVLADSRTGEALAAPFQVKGVPLINRNHPLAASYAPKVSSRYRLVPDADKAFVAMLAAAKKAGLSIVWRVGYRSYATQVSLLKSGASLYGSDARAAQYIAPPGQSEHQAGLAVDVASKAGSGTNFPKTREFAWLRANSYKYGFILRYPEGKSAITEMNYEAWHYRYIGVEAAAAFGPNSTLTLEEYLGGR